MEQRRGDMVNMRNQKIPGLGRTHSEETAGGYGHTDLSISNFSCNGNTRGRLYLNNSILFYEADALENSRGCCIGSFSLAHAESEPATMRRTEFSKYEVTARY